MRGVKACGIGVLGFHLLKVGPDLIMTIKGIAIYHVVVFAVLSHERHYAIDVAGVVIIIELLNNIFAICCPLCLSPLCLQDGKYILLFAVTSLLKATA